MSICPSITSALQPLHQVCTVGHGCCSQIWELQHDATGRGWSIRLGGCKCCSGPKTPHPLPALPALKIVWCNSGTLVQSLVVLHIMVSPLPLQEYVYPWGELQMSSWSWLLQWMAAIADWTIIEVVQNAASCSRKGGVGHNTANSILMDMLGHLELRPCS